MPDCAGGELVSVDCERGPANPRSHLPRRSLRTRRRHDQELSRRSAKRGAENRVSLVDYLMSIVIKSRHPRVHLLGRHRAVNLITGMAREAVQPFISNISIARTLAPDSAAGPCNSGSIILDAASSRKRNG